MSAPLLLLLLCPLQGPVPYPSAPDWESRAGGVATGGALVDLDLDGDLDLVVANGNDILRQPLEVYYNDGSGGFPAAPQWQSADVDYHGHLDVGDVDQDGWPDVAVSVFLGPAGFGDPGHVKLYRNLGGTLEATPSWRSVDTFFTFDCALGDADGDGDLDLAVATGEPYFDPPDHNRIYFNQGGTLATTPGWQSAAVDHSLGVSFGDADGDGDLDLAFATAAGPARVFFQGPTGFATTAGWTATDNLLQNGNSVAWADVDGDGFLELAMSDNDQLSGGLGLFKVYDNAGGVLATTPSWSAHGGMVSAVGFADVHLDGFPDFLGGVWWGGLRLYLDDAGSLSAAPDWQSGVASVAEAVAAGDLDGRGVQTSVETLPANGVARVFYLGHRPVRKVQSVRADGVALPRSAWSWHQADGWVALDRAPAASVEVTYSWSESLDLFLTNWDTSIGNHIWFRRPLVHLSLTPPPGNVFHAGDILQFQADLTSTTNRVEAVRVANWVEGPGGFQRLLDLRQEILQPFQSRSIPYSYTVPPLPPGLLGTWTVHVWVLPSAGRIPLDEGAFPVTAQ